MKPTKRPTKQRVANRRRRTCRVLPFLGPRMYADVKVMNEAIGGIIDAWCQRRALRPLSILLSAWLGNNGLTDGWEFLREALRHTRAMCREEMSAEELEIVGEAIATLDTALNR